MPQITVTTTTKQFTRKLEAFGKDIPRVAKARMFGRMEAARRRISKYPALWRGSLPKNWFKSDRQRRKVFALLHEGKIPYQRTGAYMDAWKIQKLANGYRLHTSGPRSRVAQYIGGDASGNNQARIHQGRWGVARDIVEDEIKKMPREISEDITLAARRRGL